MYGDPSAAPISGHFEHFDLFEDALIEVSQHAGSNPASYDFSSLHPTYLQL